MLFRIERSRRARSIFALVLFALSAMGLIVSACGGSAAPPAAPNVLRAQQVPAATSAPSGGGSAPVNQTVVVAGTPEAARPSGGGNVSGNALPLDRKIIKNAQLTTVVESAGTGVSRITAIAADEGGYVVGSHTFAEDNSTGAQITIAVPVDRFEETLNLVRKVALKVDSDVTSSSDVSDQYIDLNSRLKNLQATADRIRDFLNKAATVDEALKVNQQLSDVESQIEQIKGQLNVLNARTAFSTITVDMHEPRPTPTATATPTFTPTPTSIAWRPDETFNSALTTQTSILRVLGDALIWVVVVLLPYVLFLGLIGAGAAWVVRRISRPGPQPRAKTP